ncbi:hypothetical protein ACX3YG_29580 [Pseudomonas wadenswilerensis]
MTSKAVINFADRYCAPDDYLYLLVDGMAQCALNHPLSVSSLTASLGTAAVTRVLRSDISHTPESCPALIQLAAPGQAVPPGYLELSADCATWGLVHNRRYICGWLASPEPLEVVAAHIAARCETTACEDGWPTPWYEPLRMELLLGAMGDEAGELLGPIRYWLVPLSWGGFTLIRRPDYSGMSELPALARQVQQLAPVIHRFLGLWRHAVQHPPAFAPWCWEGASILPPQAGVHAFRLIRDARRLGLKSSRDLTALSLRRVLLHPHLPQHPDIQKIIDQARTGAIDLQSHFATCRDAFWKRVVADLPRAEDYS